jgi:hypothetical protein
MAQHDHPVLRVKGFEIRASGFGLGVWGVGVWGLEFGAGVWGLRFRGKALGSRVKTVLHSMQELILHH